VLVVTALGGVIGGIVGLILAVPFFAIARNAVSRFVIVRGALNKRM
jgi:predicted PurR-regulated permease PerM